MEIVELRAIGRDRLISILDGIRGLKICVLGDCGIDAFWHADMERSHLSLQAPLFVRPIINKEYSLAMAANTAKNFKRLGAQVIYMCSLLGSDWPGLVATQLLQEEGVDLKYLFEYNEFNTPLLARIILHSKSGKQEDPRIDFVNEEINKNAIDQLLQKIKRDSPTWDGLAIVENMAQSIVSPLLRKELNQLSQSVNISIVADSHNHINDYKKMSWKINEQEAVALLENQLSKKIYTLAEITSAINEFTNKQEVKFPLVITLGEAGCLLVTEGEIIQIPAIMWDRPIDALGAGDSFLAGYLSSICAGADIVEAGIIGNLVAGISCLRETKPGWAEPEEVISVFDKLSARK